MDEAKKKRLTAKGWKVHIRTNDQWRKRKRLLETLRYLATMSLKLPYWRADAKAALLLAVAIENDNV
jgi:hypothetical protein